MRCPLIIHLDKFEVSDYARKQLRQAVKDNNAPIRAYIETLTPESRQQRKYLMGGLIPLLVYLDGNDYKDNKVCEYYFEHYKKEFSPEVLKIGGKVQTFGKSTKGSKALNSFIEKLQEYLNEQHGLEYDSKTISPDFYKEFRDTIYPFDRTYEDYIDYLIKTKHIK